MPYTIILFNALIDANLGNLDFNLAISNMVLILHSTGNRWRVMLLFEELQARSEIVTSQ